VPFEVVPGVSSAIAAPALSGIPVTHRGLAAAFVVVSGHAREAYAELLGSLRPGSATVVILMGVGTRAATSALLLEGGWDAKTPAAILFAASRAESEAWRGTLGTLAQAPAETDSPGVIVIGRTVEVAAQIEALAQRGEAHVVAAR
jgi:siroheme synthase